MKNIYLYGADLAAKNYLSHFPEMKIQGFIDQDIEKQQNGFMGLPVIPIKTLKETSFDTIIITSIMYTKEMLRNLEKNNINMTKVVVPEKRYLTPILNPLKNQNFKYKIRKCLKIICEQLEVSNIQYYLMFGTLLGLVREGDFIEWDDDLDIVLYEDQRMEFKESLFNINKKIKEINSISIDESKEMLFIRFYEDGIFVFSIDFYFFRKIEQEIICGTWRFPKNYFDGYELIKFEEKRYCIPRNPKHLLEILYGENWRIPDSKFTAADYSIEM